MALKRRTAFSQLTVAFGVKRTSIDFGVRCYVATDPSLGHRARAKGNYTG